MPSKDTELFRLPKDVIKDIKDVKKRIASDLNVKESSISNKHAAIVWNIKAKRGNVYVRELNDILLGRGKL